MVKRQNMLVQTRSSEASPEFLLHIQESLLLALVDRGLLTRYQYEQCLAELSGLDNAAGN